MPLKNTHPGEILKKEFLIPMGITQYKLSQESGVPHSRISDIVRGKRSITPRTAIAFSSFFWKLCGVLDESSNKVQTKRGREEMTITTSFKDIDGRDINLGDKVFVFSQEYEVIEEDYSDGVPVIMVDFSKPLPIKDVPLFLGRVEWCDDRKALIVRVEKEFGEGRGVASFPVDFYDAYQLAEQ